MGIDEAIEKHFPSIDDSLKKYKVIEREEEYQREITPSPEGIKFSLLPRGIALGLIDVVGGNVRAGELYLSTEYWPSLGQPPPPGVPTGPPPRAVKALQEVGLIPEVDQFTVQLEMAEKRKGALKRIAKAERIASWIENLAPEELRKEVEEAASGELFDFDKRSANAWLAIVAQQIPIMAQMFVGKGVGALAGGVVAGPPGAAIGGVGGGIGAMALPEANSMIKAANRLKMDPMSYRSEARLHGLGSGAIEYAQIMWMGKAWMRTKTGKKILTKPAMEFVKKVVEEIGGHTMEGVQELSQEVLQNYFLQRAAIKHNMMHPDNPVEAPEFFEGAMRAFSIGVGVSGIVRGTGKVVTKTREQLTALREAVVAEKVEKEVAVKEEPREIERVETEEEEKAKIERWEEAVRDQFIAEKTKEYSEMNKKDLAELAAQTGEDTYSGFLKYPKEQLVRFMVFEYEDIDGVVIKERERIDREEKERLLRRVEEREEPGRAVQVEERGEEEIETGRVVQAQEIKEPKTKEEVLSEFERRLTEAKTGVVTLYHGTTEGEKIRREGFRPTEAAALTREAYEAEGIKWEDRRQFPEWARDYIEYTTRFRLTVSDIGEGTISFTSRKGVADDWAIKPGGEIKAEVQSRIQEIKDALAAGVEDEETFGVWMTIGQRKDYYPRGEGEVLSRRVKLTPDQQDSLIKVLKGYIEEAREIPEEKAVEFWRLYQGTYDVIEVRPEQIVEEVPKAEEVTFVKEGERRVIPKEVVSLAKERQALRSQIDKARTAGEDVVQLERRREETERELAELGYKTKEQRFQLYKDLRRKAVPKKPTAPGTVANLKLLRTNLTIENKMTDSDFIDILDKENVLEEEVDNVSEEKGKKIIKRMINLAPFIKIREDLKRESKEEKNAGSVDLLDEINGEIARLKKDKPVSKEEEEKITVFPTWSMRFYVSKLTEKTGDPYFEFWEALNQTHHIKEEMVLRIHERLAKTTATPRIFRKITKNKKASARVEGMILHYSDPGKFKPIKDATADEQLVAKEVSKLLKEDFENAIRFQRAVLHFYKGHKIPNAPPKDLEEVVKIIETTGDWSLVRKFTDTKKWGTIKGYAPLDVITGKVSLELPRVLYFADGHFQSREGEPALQQRTIFQRLDSYIRQVYNVIYLEQSSRALMDVFSDNSYKFEKPQRIGESLALSINEMKGAHGPKSWWGRLLRRLAAQSFAAIFMGPIKSVRNLHQNMAFNEDFALGWLFNPVNEKLTKEEWNFFDTHIDQSAMLRKQWLLQDEKPIPGLGTVTRLANSIAHYAYSDKVNRMWAFWGRLNRIKVSARDVNWGDYNSVLRFMKRSGQASLELSQQKHALEMIIRGDIHEAFMWMAAQHVANVHFQYERSQRAPAEMGEIGRVAGSLWNFPRAWAERFTLEATKVGRRGAINTRYRALGRMVQMSVMAVLAGKIFLLVTRGIFPGDEVVEEDNPYDPMRILSWVPGGLVIGFPAEICGLIWDIGRIAKGDRQARNSAINRASRLAKMGIPFYQPIRSIVNGFLELPEARGIDEEGLRKLRDVLDKRYKYEPPIKVKRDAVEKFRYMFLSVEQGVEKETPDSLARKAVVFKDTITSLRKGWKTIKGERTKLEDWEKDDLEMKLEGLIEVFKREKVNARGFQRFLSRKKVQARTAAIAEFKRRMKDESPSD